MRSTTQTVCYSSAVKVPPQRQLLLQVDQTNECLLLPLMGVYTPFHINTVKSINYSQVCQRWTDQDANLTQQARVV